MDQLHSKSVVVGMDDSQAAVDAAKWAVEQAISRQIPSAPDAALVCVGTGRRGWAAYKLPASWVRRYPEVHVQVVAAGTGMKCSENRSSAVELALQAGPMPMLNLMIRDLSERPSDE